MADRPPWPNSGDDTGAGLTEERPPGMPLWVKLFGFIIIGLLLLVGIGLIIGGGQHGPRRHAPGGDTPRLQTPGGDR